MIYPIPDRPNLSAIVLAGGLSRRMGQDKALLLTPRAQPLLTQTIQIAQHLSSDIRVVTPWPERYQAVVPDGTQLIKEMPSETSQGPLTQGPLSGFAQGWAQGRTEWCLLLACDLPCLKSECLVEWWEWLQCQLAVSDRPPIASLVPRVKDSGSSSLSTAAKRWEPLCGFYHRGCLPGLHRYLASGGRSFQSWLAGDLAEARPEAGLEGLPECQIMPYLNVPEGMLFNCNTPAEWAAITSTESL
ncbi:MAG: molybdenum cofactor guanylyltransferase [Phormidesmis sp.]